MLFVVFSIVLMIIMSSICIRAWLCLRKEKAGMRVTVPSNFLWILGIGSGVVFLSFTVVLVLSGDELWEIIISTGFVCLACYLMYIWLGLIIIYDEDGFTKGWLPWQKKHFRYSEITAIKYKHLGVVLYFGKTKIELDDRDMRIDSFVDFVSFKYENIYGTPIPEDNHIPKWDIFNGHVDSPEEFIVSDIVVLLLAILILSAVILYEAHDPVTESETDCYAVRISSCNVEKDTLILKSEGASLDFEIDAYKDYGDAIPSILKLIDESQRLYLNVIPYTEDGVVVGYDVRQVQDESGKVYISLDEVNEKSKEKTLRLLAIPFVLFVLWLVFCGGMISVGRNPQKYSKRVQRIFFKDGYLH